MVGSTSKGIYIVGSGDSNMVDTSTGNGIELITCAKDNIVTGKNFVNNGAGNNM